jgi:SOS-response transcriptional repressor LexA
MATTEKGLTATQQLTLDAVRKYIREHGISPSIRDVCAIRGLASTSSVQMHFKHLRRAGAISLRQGVPRSVQVLWAQPRQPRRQAS